MSGATGGSGAPDPINISGHLRVRALIDRFGEWSEKLAISRLIEEGYPKPQTDAEWEHAILVRAPIVAAILRTIAALTDPDEPGFASSEIVAWIVDERRKREVRPVSAEGVRE